MTTLRTKSSWKRRSPHGGELDSRRISLLTVLYLWSIRCAERYAVVTGKRGQQRATRRYGISMRCNEAACLSPRKVPLSRSKARPNGLQPHNKYKTGTSLVHKATTGTVDIIRHMMQRKSQSKPCLGIFGNVDAWNACQGQNEHAGKPFESVRAITYCFGTDHYFVVPLERE
jgi:hypothetical protein